MQINLSFLGNISGVLASRRTVLFTGLVRGLEVRDFNSIERTRSSRPHLTLDTTASGHNPRGQLSSNSKTRSPSFMLSLLLSHFCRFCSSGRYRRTQIFQKRVAKFWAWRHALRYTSSGLNFPGGTSDPARPISKWLGEI